MPTPLAPPSAALRPYATTRHGETLIDEYAWLRDLSDPAVYAYLEAENEYTTAATAYLADLRSILAAELTARISETHESAHEPSGEYRYYTRHQVGRQYPCRYRRHVTGGDEELLLDEQELTGTNPFFSLGMLRVSPDGRLLAYSVDTSGAETFDLFVRDIATGTLLEGPIANTYYSLEWAADSRTLFYSTLDAAKRPERLWRHRIGADPATDTLIYHEADAMFNVQLRKTNDATLLVLLLESNTTTEVRLLHADQPEDAFTLALPRRAGIEYRVEHRNGMLYLLTNDGGRNFRVVRTPLADPAPTNWESVVPHDDECMREAFVLFTAHLALFERRAGRQQITIIDLHDNTSHQVAFDEPTYSIGIDEQLQEYAASSVRFSYSSFTTPETVIAYDMQQQRRVIDWQQQVPGYDAAHYRSEWIHATAADGTQVPISLVYRIDLRQPGGNPTFLRGYGAYGAISTVGFEAERLSLLDRGVVVAIAHIRGGGELGRHWYEQGKLLQKRNTFTDFIACAEHLIAAGYTRPGHLAIKGRSAGGMLMGAVTTMRPDLFCAVIAGVPAVDLINTMSDPSIPLVVSEYEEWGNPAIAEQYLVMRTYSPYEHTIPQAYPALLVTAAIHDPRVVFWEPAKWVARLRAVKTNAQLLVLKTDMIGGHAGASGRYDRIDEVAFEYAFILDAMG
ncbi:MAG TPA: S9 family peptidase [Roseiflexaceae bacterium]|nr:S9 family peptidase [Roseiflexaceae bacterium]